MSWLAPWLAPIEAHIKREESLRYKRIAQRKYTKKKGGRRGRYGKPIILDGERYENTLAAAQATGFRIKTIHQWIRCGTKCRYL